MPSECCEQEKKARSFETEVPANCTGVSGDTIHFSSCTVNIFNSVLKHYNDCISREEVGCFRTNMHNEIQCNEESVQEKGHPT